MESVSGRQQEVRPHYQLLRIRRRSPFPCGTANSAELGDLTRHVLVLRCFNRNVIGHCTCLISSLTFAMLIVSKFVVSLASELMESLFGPWIKLYESDVSCFSEVMVQIIGSNFLCSTRHGYSEPSTECSF